MKKILFFMGIILAGIPALAQNETTGKYEEVVIPQALEQPIDSLLDEWKVKHYVLASDSDCMKGSNPYFPDSVYIDRLVKMPTVMEMAYNEVVRKYIDTYVEGKMREFPEN